MSYRRKRRKKNHGFKTFVLIVLIISAALMLIKYRVHLGYESNVAAGNSSGSSVSENGEPAEMITDLAEELPDDLPERLKKLYNNNPDARDFVLNYDKYKDEDFDIDLSEYENCTEVPLLMQWDKRWGYKEYSGDLFGLTGCGPTCLSMVTIYLTGDSSYTPEYMRNYAIENGYSVDGNGTAWTLFSEGAVDLGLDVTEIPLVESRVMDNLEVGNPIVCIMGPGDFTDGGHYIVFVGCEDGKIVVNDPNSYENSNKTWNFNDIKDQIRNMWVIR